LNPLRFVNRLKVGETVLAASAEHPSEVSWARKVDPFLTKSGGDIEVTVRREPVPQPGHLLFESEGVWRAYAQADGRVLLTFRVGKTIYKAALVDREVTRGEIFYPRRADGRGSRSAMNFPLDEMLFQHHWAHSGRVEVHSFGVRDRGGVLVFTGHSGAGKSTSAKIWHRFEPESPILSDDRILLDPRDRRRIVAHGTPWHGLGRFGTPKSGSLRALFFLEQAKVPEAVPLHPAEAAARLFTRAFPPIWDREATQKTVDACGDIAERVPSFLLRFRKDRSAIETARAAVAKRR
jgi:hypothetical protein